MPIFNEDKGTDNTTDKRGAELIPRSQNQHKNSVHINYTCIFSLRGSSSHQNAICLLYLFYFSVSQSSINLVINILLVKVKVYLHAHARLLNKDINVRHWEYVC